MAISTNGRSSKSATSLSRGFDLENLESRQLMSVSVGHAPERLETPVKPAAAVNVNRNHKPVTSAPSMLPVTKVAITPIRLPIIYKPIFIEPQVDSNVVSWKNYSSNPLFAPGGPSPKDIAQGQIGDCYFLASLASVAQHDPGLIEKDITQRADGTYDVYFHKSASTTVDIHVDGKLPLNSWGGLEYAKLGTSGSTWVAIMEKAFTYFRNPSVAACYTNIAYGWGSEALGDLGGSVTEVLPGVSNATTLFNDVVWSLIFNVATDFGTKGTGGGPLVHSHEYSVVSARVQGGVDQIEVRNPWGYNPGFVANNGVYGATNDGYMWVNASSVLPELDEFVNASV